MSGKNDRDTKPWDKREGMRRRSLLLGTTSIVALSGISATAPLAQAQQAEEILPKPEPPFQGKVGRTVKDSTPDFPKGAEAPAGAPNVLLIRRMTSASGRAAPLADRSKRPISSGSPIPGFATTCITRRRSARRRGPR